MAGVSRGLGKTQRAIVALLDDGDAHRTIRELADSIYGVETSVGQRQNVRRAAHGLRRRQLVHTEYVATRTRGGMRAMPIPELLLALDDDERRAARAARPWWLRH